MGTPLENWVDSVAKLTKPDKVYWCNGSEEEARHLIEVGMKDEKVNGHPVFQELNHKTFPNSYYHRSHPTDVARTEHLTFVCHPDKETAGPNNNWMDPAEAKTLMSKLSDGCMRGRTMYVLPYMMGHPESPYAKACIQLTDLSYVAVSMRIMTRMSRYAVAKIGNDENFVKGIHSVGDFDPNKRYVMHFPDEHLVWSIGSGYGGNALLGKKCFALRIASVMAKEQGWLAEHMLILGITSPKGEKKYIAAAFPSACGKTNLAMLIPTIPGWKVECVGDDIAWMKFGEDGRLYAINPEAGFFGVAPGTSMDSNPNAMHSIEKNTIFTNVALTEDKDIWWEGIGYDAPGKVIDWNGNEWVQNKADKSQKPAAHPNARFTAPAKQCPAIDKAWEDPKGVPISAILFGGRRPSTIPLVHQARSWNHGVFLGSIVGSEITAAAISANIGQVRRDPFAMLPFCGYNMGDYFNHWISIGKKSTEDKLPKIFYVNWFRKTSEGKWLWPGYGENSRVLKWVFERTEGTAKAVETPIGFMPSVDAIDRSGLDVSEADMTELLKVDKEEWKKELSSIKEHYTKFGDKLPKELNTELATLESKLN